MSGLSRCQLQDVYHVVCCGKFNMEVLVPVHFGRMELAGWVADFVVLRLIFLPFLFPVLFLTYRAMILTIGLSGEEPRSVSIEGFDHIHIHTYTHTFAHPNTLR